MKPPATRPLVLPMTDAVHTVDLPMPSPACDLLVLDLDGTLVNSASRIAPADLAAVHKAMDAGIEVVICTGRGHAECRHLLESIHVTAPVIVAGGAMTVEPMTGQTIDRSVMDVDLVREVATMVNKATGHYALLLKDRWSTGLDYVMVGEGKVDPASEWWFGQVDVVTHRAQHIDDDPFPRQTVRLGIVTTAGEMRDLSKAVTKQFGSRTFIHDFPVINSDGNGRHLQDAAIHLMEIFNSQTNKWFAVEALAARKGISRDRIAAVGDEINDIDLIRHAGLGIAMGNAVPALKAVADHITLPQSENGVAHAIQKILGENW